MSERRYAAVEVIGKAGGMNQAGWDGSILDSEATYLYNVGTTIDGEWSKRKGYTLAKTIVIAAEAVPVMKLHWHTDTYTNQADGSGWVESGDEVTSASSGALTVSECSASYSHTVDGETVSTIKCDDIHSYVEIHSSFNFNATAGRMVFSFFVAATGYPIGTLKPPDKKVYLFYGSSNFNIFISDGSVGGNGHLIWKYGSAATEFIDAGHVSLSRWYKIDIRWDNDTGGTIYPYRYQFFIDSSLVGYADPTSAVSSASSSFDTHVYFFNTGTSGDSAPMGEMPGGYANWSAYGAETKTRLAAITTWDSSSATVVNPAITGIHNNSSQQRAIITAGIATPAAGVAYYSPSWTAAAATAGSYAIAGVRTAAAECQGNIYMTDGSDTMHYFAGALTTVSEYTLPETAKWIEEFHGHLWIAGLGTNGSQSVRCSTIDDFTTSSAVSWPSTNQVFKCRDTVRGIKAYAGQLIVGTRTTIESITGYQPHDFAKTIISGGANCASHWSMQEVPLQDGAVSALIWAGYDGIYMLVGQQLSKISWAIQDFYNGLSKTEIEESHAVDCRQRGEYMLAVSDGSTTDNNYIIVYNYRKGDWAIWKYANRMDVLGKYYKSGVETILGGDSQGNLFELNRGDSDNGTSIDGYVLTKWFDGGLPDQDKDFRKLYLWSAPIENYNLEVGWSADYKEGFREASVVVGTDGKDYKCIVSHEPSVVVGDDGNDYYCTDAHVSTYLTKPGVNVWKAETNYAANDIVTPTTPDGHIYRVTTDNGISGATEPASWDTTHGNTTNDGDLVWTNDGTAASSSYWTATGTVGRGEAWALSTYYISNDDRKPITGSQYSQYFVPNNTIGAGDTWSASAGYSQESIQMDNNQSLMLGDGEDLFGTAIFGTDVFGSGVSTKVFPLDLYNARGKSIRFMFRNENADEPFSIRGFKAWFTYIPEFPA